LDQKLGKIFLRLQLKWLQKSLQIQDLLEKNNSFFLLDDSWKILEEKNSTNPNESFQCFDITNNNNWYYQ